MADSQKSVGFCIPKRYILAFLGFFGLFNVYAMRVNLSVAMVAMINNTDSDVMFNLTSKPVECAMLRLSEEKSRNIALKRFRGEQYNWDAKTQGKVLGAFFYGYVLTQIPGGYIAGKYGAKWLFGGGVFITSFLTLLTPLSVRMGTSVFMTLRILEGIGEGVTFPAMVVIVSKWSPLMERSRVSTIIFMGGQIGSVVSMPISGLLSSSGLLGGWPSVFYLFGTIGCIWFAFWAFLVFESPYVHPTISEEELSYFKICDDNVPQKKPSLPIKSILMSLPMWATLVAHFGHNFGLTIYLIELPNFLSTILHFSIAEDGVLSALPFITQAATACFASFIADKLRSSGKLSITCIRKVMNSIGLVGPAVSLLFVTIAGCRQDLVVVLLILAVSLNGFVFSGFNITHVDMSPDFSGTLYGITNSCANLCGVLAPAIVGAVTADGATIASWNKVFYITSGAYIGGAIFYLIFASAEQQPWGSQVKQKEQKDDSMVETNTRDLT